MERFAPVLRPLRSAWGLVLVVCAALAFFHYRASTAETGAWLGLGVMEVDVVSLALLYAGFVIVIRWQMIAWPIHNQIQARLASLRARLPTVTDPSVHATLDGLLERAVALTSTIQLADVLFWSRGRETAGWQLIDDAEQLLVSTWPEERVLARAPALADELDALGTKPASLTASALRQRATEGADRPADVRALRELIVQGMIQQRAVLRQQDLAIDYHNNKLMWYIIVSLMALVLVANFLPDILGRLGESGQDPEPYRHRILVLIIAGAVGGVLSRLTRAVKSDYTTHELGLRWMALFLSPLLGALAGWAGVVLLDLLQGRELLTLGAGTAFGRSEEVGIAILFGLSERMFTDLAGRAEAKVVNGAKGGAGDQRGASQGGSTSPSASGGDGAGGG